MSEAALSYCVLLRRPEQLDFAALAKALARWRGVPVLDAMAQARSCWGILSEGQGETAAKDFASILEAAGLSAVALPQGLLEDLPPEIFVVRAELRDRIVLFDALGQSHLVENPELLAAAILKRSTSQTIKVQKDIGLGDKALQIGLLMATGLPIKTARLRKEESKTVSSPELWGVFDLVLASPTRRLRLVSENFDFSCLREQKTYASLENFRLLVRCLAESQPDAARNRGLRFIQESRPQKAMGYGSAADLERESRWLLTLRAIQPPPATSA